VGRLLPTVLCAAFTTLCRAILSAAVQLPCHTVMQVQRMLSTAQWYKLLRTELPNPALRSFLRK